ncbi:hypothetical protein [uncultured Pontibacter sp.]|uniref:hypothetical protein n=1 Tax=uncultured Pontibacter sp. TaxID=453356 RepID=UPI00263904FA|nr:hypothetical protein [uncultured Pontibacter sp.]
MLSAPGMADGGLYITSLESAIPEELDLGIRTDRNFRKDAFLFAESQSRVTASVSLEQQAAFEQAMQNKGVNFTQLGMKTSHDHHIDGLLYYAATVVKKY